MSAKVSKLKGTPEDTTRRHHGWALSANADDPDEQLRMLAARFAAIGYVLTDCTSDIRECSMALVGLGGILADYSEKLDEVADRVMNGGAA